MLHTDSLLTGAGWDVGAEAPAPSFLGVLEFILANSRGSGPITWGDIGEGSSTGSAPPEEVPRSRPRPSGTSASPLAECCAERGV